MSGGSAMTPAFHALSSTGRLGGFVTTSNPGDQMGFFDAPVAAPSAPAVAEAPVTEETSYQRAGAASGGARDAGAGAVEPHAARRSARCTPRRTALRARRRCGRDDQAAGEGQRLAREAPASLTMRRPYRRFSRQSAAMVMSRPAALAALSAPCGAGDDQLGRLLAVPQGDAGGGGLGPRGELADAVDDLHRLAEHAAGQQHREASAFEAGEEVDVAQRARPGGAGLLEQPVALALAAQHVEGAEGVEVERSPRTWAARRGGSGRARAAARRRTSARSPGRSAGR